MTIRSPRTAEELMKLSYLPVRKGIRTDKQIWMLFQPSVIPEISVIAMAEAPFSRVFFSGETYSNQVPRMDKLVAYLRVAVRDDPTKACEQLKKQKAQWEAENLS